MSRCLCSTALSGCLLAQFLLKKTRLQTSNLQLRKCHQFSQLCPHCTGECITIPVDSRVPHCNQQNEYNYKACVSPGDVVRVACSVSQPLPPLLTASPAVHCTDFARGRKTTSEYSHTRSPGLITQYDPNLTQAAPFLVGQRLQIRTLAYCAADL